MFDGFSVHSREILISTDEQDVAWAVHNSNATIQTCIRILLDRLLAGGIDILNEKNEKISPIFKEQVIDKYYDPFIRKLIKYLHIFGVAAIQIVPEDGHLVPIVLDYGTYDIKFVDYVGKMRDYFVYRRNTAFNSVLSKPDPNVVLVIEDEPSSDGSINSRIGSLLRSQQFLMSLENFTIVAEVGRSKPLLITETKENAGALSSVDANQTFYTPADKETVASNKRVQRALVTARATKYNQQMVDKINEGLSNGNIRDPTTQIPLLQGSQDQAYKRQIYPLAPDAHLVNQLMPQIRTDLIDHGRESKQAICGVFGVPEVTFNPSSAGQQHAANADQTNTTLDNTVRHLKILVTPIIRDIYVSVYGPEDQDFYRKLRLYVARKRKITRTQKDGSSYSQLEVGETRGKDSKTNKIKKSTKMNASEEFASHWDQKALAALTPPQIKVVFGGVIEPTNLRTMYDRGEIDAKMFRMYMARHHGVPEETFREQPIAEIDWRREMEEKQLGLQERQFELSVKVADDQAKLAQQQLKAQAQAASASGGTAGKSKSKAKSKSKSKSAKPKAKTVAVATPKVSVKKATSSSSASSSSSTTKAIAQDKTGTGATATNKVTESSKKATTAAANKKTGKPAKPQQISTSKVKQAQPKAKAKAKAKT